MEKAWGRDHSRRRTEINIFFKILKIKTVPVLFCMSTDGFHNVWLSFCEEYSNVSFCLLL
jgi:hypothetical protein